jgi:hypothetical protein
VFIVATIMNLLVAFAALFILKPMRHRKIKGEAGQARNLAVGTA